MHEIIKKTYEGTTINPHEKVGILKVKAEVAVVVDEDPTMPHYDGIFVAIPRYRIGMRYDITDIKGYLYHFFSPNKQAALSDGKIIKHGYHKVLGIFRNLGETQIYAARENINLRGSLEGVLWVDNRNNEWEDDDALLRYAQGILEEFTAYLDGEVYGYKSSIVVENEEGWKKEVYNDSCWGYYGHPEYVMQDALMNTIYPLNTEELKTTEIPVTEEDFKSHE